MSTEVNDTHYEAVLDDEPDWGRPPVYVDVVSKPETDRRPIVPAQYRPSNLPKTVKRAAGLHWYRTRFHTPRLFLRYLPLGTFYAIVGVFRLVNRQLAWWWVSEQQALRQEAATTNEPMVWMKLHREAKHDRLWRGIVLGFEVIAVIVAVSLLLTFGDLLIRIAVGVPAAMLLAHYGRPIDSPIVSPAVVRPRYRLINADVVLRAYYAAKLGKPGDKSTEVDFGSRMERDGNGGRVVVNLPHGTTFEDAMKAKGRIASGLDVSVNQVFLSRDKASERSHELYVADVDPLSIPAGLTPMLNCKETDIWRPVPFGLDQYGKKVSVPLLWNSILIGAQPRKGKTFAGRLMALHAALDPYTQIIVADGKMSPNWKDFRLVTHRYIAGTHPNPLCTDPIGDLLAALREVKAHIQEVNGILSGLPASVCPEGKLTRELSRTHPKLRVWLLVMEEFQLYYEYEEKDAAKEIAELLSFILSVGPSAGVVVLSLSQKPSGIGGAGNIGTLFTRYRDNHIGRFALKCGSRTVSEAVLGTEAYGEGYDASALPVGDEYRGVGILYGLADDVPVVRTYLAEDGHAEKILMAARARREQRGTLTGFAAGEEMSREFRDVLRDVDSVFYAGEVWISWPQLAKRLRELNPEHYADITPGAISKQIRDMQIEAKKGRDTFEDGSPSVWGVPREQVAQALHKREIEGAR